MQDKKIGFIGQGWIGKNYADNFEERKFKVVRYDLSKKYSRNKSKIKDCEIVFVAVPTPSTKDGFDDSILIDAISKTHPKQIVVIKSTMQVGTTDKIQKLFKDRYIIHSPEFLTEVTAKYDAANPARNIIGYTKKSFSKTTKVMNVLPAAPYEKIVPCREAELVKYAGNILLYFKVMTANLIYDVSEYNGLDYELIKDMLGADKRIGRTHLDVVHKSGRGAGGHCFIKDMAAFREMYWEIIKTGMVNWTEEQDDKAYHLIFAIEEYNYQLLKNSKKDLDLLEGVYGA